jgi:hypothetical protein
VEGEEAAVSEAEEVLAAAARFHKQCMVLFCLLVIDVFILYYRSQASMPGYPDARIFNIFVIFYISGIVIDNKIDNFLHYL